MKHRPKSKLSKKQKTQLNNLRKWIVKERKRLRLPNEPKFSYTADSYTNKIQLCYSVPYQDGFDKNGKPKVKRKQKKSFVKYISLDSWKDIRVKDDYEMCAKVNEVKNMDKWKC